MYIAWIKKLGSNIWTWFDPASHQYGCITVVLMFAALVVGIIVIMPNNDAQQPLSTNSTTSTVQNGSVQPNITSTSPVSTVQSQASTEIPSDTTRTEPNPTYPLMIARSADTVALCIRQPVDPTKVQLTFRSINEFYMLKEMFDNMTLSSEGCWCIQQPNRVFPIPTYCERDNTFILEDQAGNWWNATIVLSVNGDDIGECAAQPTNRETYQCNFEPPQ